MAEVLDTTSYKWPKWPWKKTDAVDDKASVSEDEADPVIINVLANDTNAKGVYKIFPVKETTTDVSLTDDALTDSVAAAEDYTTSLSTKPYTITLESGATVKLENGEVTYDPNGKFEHLNDGQTALDSFGYAAYGSYNTDRARVDVTIKGVTDEPSSGNQPPVANPDVAYLNSYPYPYPVPYPLPETEAGTTSGETSTVEADLSDDLIYTTLALGEEGDPDPIPVPIDVLANDIDPDGDEAQMTIGTINGTQVVFGQKDIPVGKFGATVTISDDGKTLTYDPESLIYYSSDPLAVEGDTAVTASGDAETTVLWEPYPYSDMFTYQAKDELGALSNKATVTVYRDPIWYYDVGTDPVLEGTTDVGDSGLLTV